MNTKSIALEKKKNNISEDNLVEQALSDEYDAIDLYERILAVCDEEDERKIFEEILKDEESHARLLNKIKEGKSSPKEIEDIG